jgi:hypothetical protein
MQPNREPILRNSVTGVSHNRNKSVFQLHVLQWVMD